MALPVQDLYTIKDIYELPDGERSELIDGHIYYMAPPSKTHQSISSFLHFEIYGHIKSHSVVNKEKTKASNSHSYWLSTELTSRLELPTSSLPMRCATTCATSASLLSDLCHSQL